MSTGPAQVRAEAVPASMKRPVTALRMVVWASMVVVGGLWTLFLQASAGGGV